MRTSRSDTQLIEKLLQGQLQASESPVFEQRWQEKPRFRLDFFAQKKLLKLLRIYHRQEEKKAFEAIHQKLMSDPNKSNWRRSVLDVFGL
jgi:hypothetical protein